MNKKTKWGIIILIGAGIIGGGIYSQLPKTNDELAAADKVKHPKEWEENSERQCQSHKTSTINRRIHHYRCTFTGRGSRFIF